MFKLLLLPLAVFLLVSVSTAEAARKRLPCGDYDGAPSHNDCAPVNSAKKSKCQKWLDKHNATNDQKIKDRTKGKYIWCVTH